MEGCPLGVPVSASLPVELLKLMLAIQKQTVQRIFKNLFRISPEDLGQSWSPAPIS